MSRSAMAAASHKKGTTDPGPCGPDLCPGLRECKGRVPPDPPDKSPGCGPLDFSPGGPGQRNKSGPSGLLPAE